MTRWTCASLQPVDVAGQENSLGGVIIARRESQMTSIPQSLTEKLRGGKVIPFVGAGISMAVRRRSDGTPLFPSWKELLLGAADRLGGEGKPAYAGLVRNLLEIDHPDYLQAAKYARDQLREVWIDLLKEKLDPRRGEVDPDSLALAQTIWELGSPLLLTTNYDRVLRWACPDRLRDDLGEWDIQSPAEQALLLRQDGIPHHATVWHLHGQIQNAADLILTPDGYERLYSSDVGRARYGTARATLRSLLASRSLLFVGFSFGDDRLGIELRAVQEIFEGTSSTHFALVHESEVDRMKAQRLPLELIPFTNFGAPLLKRLRDLASEVKNSSVTMDASSGRTSPTVSFSNLSKVEVVASYSLDYPPFFVPFRPKEDRVIGRDGALRAVREQLLSGRRTAIGQTASFQGLGGLGKTQLAVEYAWKYRTEYPNGVIWIHADQDISAQLTRLAVEAKWVAPESEHHTKLDIARHRIRSYSDCLIIFDNLEDVVAIEPYLPEPGTNPHLLATSRTEQPSFTAIELLLLDPDQSLKLLILEANRTPEGLDDEKAAEEIVRQLGGLPLALEMAGAYLFHRDLLSFRNYNERLSSNFKTALRADLLSSFTKHEQDLFATLQIQAEALEEEPLLVEILDVLTWSAPVSIGLSLLSSILGLCESGLLSALALGVKLRLLDRDAEKSRYGIHRLVSRVRQEEIPLQNRTDWVESLCQRLGDWFEARREDFSDLPSFEAEIDHLSVWQNHAVNLESPHASRLIWLQAYPAHHRGLYKDAQAWVIKAQVIFSELGLEDRQLEAHLWSDLAVTYWAMGEARIGLECQEKALAIRRKFLGNNHKDTALSLLGIASYYGGLGEHNRALELGHQALEVLKQQLGEKHKKVAACLNLIGEIYEQQGKYNDALSSLQQGLEIQVSISGMRHPDTADFLDEIGLVYSDLGKLEDAFNYKLRALEVFRDVLGDQHPRTATSLNNVGTSYAQIGEHKKALIFHEQALDLRRKLLGEQHPHIAVCLLNLGTDHNSLGNYEQAISLQLEAVNLQIAAFGEQHPRTALYLANLAHSYGKVGKFDDELRLQLQALEIRKIVLGVAHPHTAESVYNVTHVLNTLGRRREAFEVLESYFREVPPQQPIMQKLRSLRAKLLRNTLRPGFRQPSSKPTPRGNKRK
jgi:tetratricopeptide (TPR) repeat protein